VSFLGSASKAGKRIFATRSRRLTVYLVVLTAIAAWRFLPRPWSPAFTVTTQHFTIFSSAPKFQAEMVGITVEQLYAAYSNQFYPLPAFTSGHAPLKMKLYKDRKEFRRVNPGVDWAEAFYRKPYCHAYHSEEEINPYHWMVHEAVHQLNSEVAHIEPVKWLEEGLAEYFSTSRFTRGRLAIGHIDPNTYPVWWLETIATTGNLDTNIQNGSVIPLRAIVSGKGGPLMRRHVNLYYLHWWTLTHFVFETPKYRTNALKLIMDGGGVEAFEKHVGKVESIQSEWHEHVRRLKAEMAEGLPLRRD
jgi:hypothetical protein